MNLQKHPVTFKQTQQYIYITDYKGVEFRMMVVWPTSTGHFIHLSRQDRTSLCFSPDVVHNDW